MLFGDVDAVTCLPGFTVSGGVKVRRGRRFLFLCSLFQRVHHEVAVSLSTRPNEVSEKSSVLSQVRADSEDAMRELSFTDEYFDKL